MEGIQNNNESFLQREVYVTQTGEVKIGLI